MNRVNITELRQNLPKLMKRVDRGERLQVTVRGRVVAYLVPALEEQRKAKARIAKWRKTVKLGDVLTPTGAEWNAEHGRL
jgi:prevent-host-death family protein